MFTGFCLHVSLLSTSVLPISVVVRHSVVVLTILCFISYIQTFHNSTFFYAKCSFIDTVCSADTGYSMLLCCKAGEPGVGCLHVVQCGVCRLVS